MWITIIGCIALFIYNLCTVPAERRERRKTDAERVADKEAEAEKRRKIAHEIAFGDLHGPHKYS